MMEQAYIKLKDAEIPVEFMGVFQSSVLIEPSPLIGGHTGGIVANPVAVVKVEGVLRQYKVEQVFFKETAPSWEYKLDQMRFFDPIIRIDTTDGVGTIERRLKNMAREFEKGGR